MKALHAEGLKRGFDHEGLRDIARERFDVESMAQLSIDQLQQIYRGFRGRWFPTQKRRNPPLDPPLPERGSAEMRAVDEMVPPEHLETLARAFAMRGWGAETQRTFIRRQLKGREQIRTKRDFQKVFRGVQAMNRRDRIPGA